MALRNRYKFENNLLDSVSGADCTPNNAPIYSESNVNGSSKGYLVSSATSTLADYHNLQSAIQYEDELDEFGNEVPRTFKDAYTFSFWTQGDLGTFPSGSNASVIKSGTGEAESSLSVFDVGFVNSPSNGFSLYVYVERRETLNDGFGNPFINSEINCDILFPLSDALSDIGYSDNPSSHPVCWVLKWARSGGWSLTIKSNNIQRIISGGGVVVGTHETSVSLANTNVRWSFITDYSKSQNFYIDDLRIYESLIDANELANIQSGEVAATPPVLTSITGSTTGEPSERIGQNATIEGLDLQNITLLLRDPNEPLDLRPINRWKFEDNLLDSEGDANGTASNAVYVVSDVSSSSKALAFNVANATTAAHYKVDTAGQNALNSSLSASFWAKGQVKNGFEKVEMGSQFERITKMASFENVVVAGSGTGVGDAYIHTSYDYGRTFTKTQTISGANYVWSVHCTDSGVFLVGVGNDAQAGSSGLFRSLDKGDSFQQIATSEFSLSVDLAVRAISSFGDTVYVSKSFLLSGVQRSRIYKSTDLGDNFSLNYTSASPYLGTYGIVALSDSKIIFDLAYEITGTTRASDIFVSNDSGASVSKVYQVDRRILCVIKKNENIVAFGGFNSTGRGVILKTENGGTSWETIIPDNNLAFMVDIDYDPVKNLFYIGADGTSTQRILITPEFSTYEIYPSPKSFLGITAIKKLYNGMLLLGTGVGTNFGDIYRVYHDVSINLEITSLFSHKSPGYETETPNSNSVQIKLVDSPFFGYLFEFNATQYDINGDLQTIAKAVFRAQDYYDDNSITPQNVDSCFIFILDYTKSGNDRAKLVVYTPTYTSATLEPISLEITDLDLLNNILAEWKLVPDLGLPFEGSYNFQIDDLRIYDFALENDQVLEVLQGEIEPPHPSYSPWQNITAQIQSSSETEIIFQTPEFELGNYKIAVENEIGISNELDFTILAKAQALFRKLRNMFNQIGKSVSGDLISCAVSDLINPNGCSEFFGNLLKNGSFCETIDHWGVATTGGASSSSGSIVDREFHLVVNNGGSVDTDITISQHNILFRERTTYTLDIMAKTSAQTQTLRVQVTCGSESVERLITLGQTHTAFKIPPFTFFSSTFGSVRIFCGGAGNTGTIQIAYINLQELR
jgi:hypothetical protein